MWLDEKSYYLVFIGLCILFATGLLTRWLLTYLKMPARLPESFWLWMGDMFGIQDAEGQIGLEIWTGLGFSFIVVLFSAVVGRFVWRGIQYVLTNKDRSRG